MVPELFSLTGLWPTGTLTVFPTDLWLTGSLTAVLTDSGSSGIVSSPQHQREFFITANYTHTHIHTQFYITTLLRTLSPPCQLHSVTATTTVSIETSTIMMHDFKHEDNEDSQTEGMSDR